MKEVILPDPQSRLPITKSGGAQATNTITKSTVSALLGMGATNSNHMTTVMPIPVEQIRYLVYLPGLASPARATQILRRCPP